MANNARPDPPYFDGPMEEHPAFHDYGATQLIDGAAAPPNLPMSADLDRAIDSIFLHPNVGPFLARRLIPKLVTGNPFSAYVTRIAAAFDDNGSGVRGDLKAVVRAILLDPEARANRVLPCGDLAPVPGGALTRWSADDEPSRFSRPRRGPRHRGPRGQSRPRVARGARRRRRLQGARPRIRVRRC